MRKILFLLSLFVFAVFIALQFKASKRNINVLEPVLKHQRLLNKEGLRIQSRVNLPNGYKRVAYPKGSCQEYFRNYRLKPFGAKIINYDNTEYLWQQWHIGVLDIPVPKNGLPQCADALIRIRSEYLWDRNRNEAIGFICFFKVIHLHKVCIWLRI
ncbi:DUF4846 domain-containing protein [Hyunsoonleella jejuensis]|uniref:DUF4846 domain-containing protein n=1 Tax=Hyunsoonleella jejuensis TaxID=419940 RepID=UPI000B256CCB|nr:DUF4846 domain-containing protein [Hyunsoonleella jejuensis]